MAGKVYHSWNGTTLTITSDSGTSSADLKGDTGIRGAQGEAGTINYDYVYTKDSPPTAEEVGARAIDWLPTLDEISGAPDGYGLGKVCKKIDSVKNITANGWWLSNGNTADGNYWICLSLVTNSGNDVVVNAWSLTGANNAILHKKSGTWGEWEWSNPPMALGKEYRTTEKWQGKAIYTKAISCGNLPNNTVSSVAHNASLTNIIKFNGTLSDGKALPYRYGNNLADIGCSKTHIHITTNYNYSDLTAIVQIWYLKD